MKLLSGLFALILLLAACANDGGDATETGGSADDDTVGASDAEGADAEADADDGDADSGEADDSSDGSSDSGDGDDATADDGSSAGDASDGSDASSAGDGADDGDADSSDDDGAMGDEDDETAADGQDPGALGPFLSAFFLETGVEPTDEVLDCLTDRDIDLDLGIVANESDLLEPTLALMACAPDELAANLAVDVTPPPGTSTDDVECVIAQTFRYMGELPPDVAQAGLAADNVPEQFRADLTPIVENVCDLSAEQAQAIFDA